MSFHLTPNQISFVENFSTGIDASNAYRASYNAAKMSSKTIWEAASRLSKNPKVVARLDQLTVEKEQNKRMFALSYEDRIINKLWEIVDQSKNNQIRLKALKLLGDTSGLFR